MITASSVVVSEGIDSTIFVASTTADRMFLRYRVGQVILLVQYRAGVVQALQYVGPDVSLSFDARQVIVLATSFQINDEVHAYSFVGNAIFDMYVVN